MKDTIIYIRKSREDLENKDDTLKNLSWYNKVVTPWYRILI